MADIFADNIFRCIFLKIILYLNSIFTKFVNVPKCSIDNKSALMKAMAWHQNRQIRIMYTNENKSMA